MGICNALFHFLAKNIFNISEPQKNRGKAKKPLPPEALQILRSKMQMEYELYEFLKVRLKQQSRTLRQWRFHKQKKPVFYKGGIKN